MRGAPSGVPRGHEKSGARRRRFVLGLAGQAKFAATKSQFTSFQKPSR